MEHMIDSLESVGKNLGGLLIFEWFHVFEMRVMRLGKDPCFKGKAGCERSDCHKRWVLGDDPAPLLHFLPDDIAEDAPIFVLEVSPAPFDLLVDTRGDDGEGDELRVRMLEGGSRSDPVIFEDQEVSKAPVADEIKDAFPVSPEDIFHRLGRERGKGFIVRGGFNHHLMGSDAVHPVVDSFPLSIEVPLDPEGGELIGNDPEGPTRGVGGRSIVPKGEDFGRRFVFVAFTEGAKPAAGS